MARPRRRRTLRWVVAIACLLAAYPVLGTLALWTGVAERLIRSKHLVVYIENPAWTLWPGRVHVANARILANGDTQFELKARNLLFEVELFSLLRKHLHVTSLEGDDVRYFMRVRVDDPSKIQQRAAAFPQLNDLPGEKTLHEREGQGEEQREGGFTVHVEGIDVDVAELWFFEYHFVGDATLRGDFLIGPRRLRVGTSVQELGPGELRFGRDQVIAKNFRGRIQASVPEVNPEEHADAGFLELVTGNVELHAEIQTLKHVAAYLPQMDVEDGAGAFAAKVLLEKGYLGDGSYLTFQTDKVALKGKGFSVLTDWVLDTRVATGFDSDARDENARSTPGPSIRTAKPAAAAQPASPQDEGPLPRLRSSAKSSYVSFANEQGDIFTVQIHGHQQDVTLTSKQLGSITDVRHARVRFPEIVSGDMDDLAALSKGSAPVESKHGTARASLFLEMDEKHVARGPLKAKFDGLRLIVAGIDVRGEGSAELRIAADLDKKAATFDDVSVKLRNVDLRVKDEQVDDWWLELASQRVSTWGVPPTRIEADVSARARNAEPFLQTLSAKGELNELIADVVALNDLKLRGKLRKRGNELDVILDPLETNLVDVAGRLYTRGNESQLALVVGGKAVSLGIAKNAEGTTLKPFAREGWLNEQLREFPNPDERVKPSKP